MTAQSPEKRDTNNTAFDYSTNYKNTDVNKTFDLGLDSQKVLVDIKKRELINIKKANYYNNCIYDSNL